MLLNGNNLDFIKEAKMNLYKFLKQLPKDKMVVVYTDDSACDPLLCRGRVKDILSEPYADEKYSEYDCIDSFERRTKSGEQRLQINVRL